MIFFIKQVFFTSVYIVTSGKQIAVIVIKTISVSVVGRCKSKFGREFVIMQVDCVMQFSHAFERLLLTIGIVIKKQW